MEKVKKRRSPIMERLMADMEQCIRDNEFSVNSMMPSIRVLAARYSASPRTVESALRQMCDRNLLQRVPNRGFKVLENGTSGNARIAILHQAHGMLDPRPAIAAAIYNRLDFYGYQWDSFDLMERRPELEFLKENYAAVIFARQLHRGDYAERLTRSGMIQVIAGRETDVDVPSSYVDREALIRSTVRMLFDMGHRDIALVVRHEDRYFYPRMIRAYHEILAELGLRDDENSLAVMRHDFELGAYLCGRDLLNRSHLPTAVIVSRDYQACGVHQACIEKGLVVGRDISLIGYDDIGWTAGRDFLTTYVEPCEELGGAAVDVLRSILTGDGGMLQREVKPALKMRRSLAPIVEF